MGKRQVGIGDASAEAGYRLLCEANAELARLRQVRGTFRRTARRMRRALAILGLAGALLGLPLAGTARAVAPVYSATSTNPFGLVDIGDWSIPSFADIDGDGDLDAFIGENYGNTVFFLNTGTAIAPAFAASSLNPFGLVSVGNTAAPAFVDIDGDGDLDAFVGDLNGNVIFFRNTGTAIAPAFAASSLDPFGLVDIGDNAAPAFVDIDGDGDLDLFVGRSGSSGGSFFFRNTGTAIAPAFAAPSANAFGLPNLTGEWPAFADINGDGSPDALIGTSDGDLVYASNTGTAIAPAFGTASTNPFGLTGTGDDKASPSLVDIDGDGDLDAFVGSAQGNTVFFLNTAVPPPPNFAATSTNPFGLVQVSNVATPEFADIDGDGDLDAFIGDEAGNTIFFRNTGTAIAPAFAGSSNDPFGLAGVGGYSAPAFADIDGDGDIDAFIGNADGFAVFFRNTGTAVAPAFAASSVDPFGLVSAGRYSSPAFADIDGDGDLDAFIANEEGNTIFFRNTGTAIAPAFAGSSVNPFGLAYVGLRAAPALVDIDGDGDLDAFIGNQYGNSILFRNTGTAIAPAFAAPSTNPFGLADVGFHATPTFVPIRADGHLDAFIGNFVGNTIYFRNDAPTPARIVTDGATRWADGAVRVEWRTSQEVDHLGMRVWRDAGEGRELVTPGLVAGSALTQGGVALEADSVYGWWDRVSPDAGPVEYWLEAVDLAGGSVWHGPIVPVVVAGEAPAKPSARLLEEVGRAAAVSAATLTSSAAAMATREASAGESIARQRRLAARPAAKMTVRETGWYRVTYEELAAAGFDAGSDAGASGRQLKLFLRGERQALRVGGQVAGRFGPGSYVEFYGTGQDTASSDAQVHWLVSGSGARRPVRKLSRAAEAGGAAQYEAAVTWKPRTVYSAGLKNGEAENFYGPPVLSTPLRQSIFLSGVSAETPEPAAVTVALRGLSFVAHRVEVRLNGTALGEISFEGQAAGEETFAVDSASLVDGENFVEMRATGAAPDVSLVDRVEIRFARAYAADGDEIEATTETPTQTLTGFATPDVRVFDVTRPDRARELAGTVRPDGDGHAVSVRLSGEGERRLLAVTGAQLKQVAAIELNAPSRLAADAGGADLLILTHGDFAAAAATLAEARRGEGFAVSVVDVADVFDEYGFGTPSPEAVKAFLADAGTRWQPRPRWVLLFGDATYDPKDHLGSGVRDDVPTKLIEASRMETASDGWLADFDGDGVPEMAIGRLPVNSAASAEAVVAKLTNPGTGAGGPAALLISDRADGLDFARSAGSLAAELASTMTVTEVRRGDGGAAGDAQARDEVRAGFAAGPTLVAYLGHGSNALWRGDLLTTEDAASLGNASNPAVVAAMTCLNGSFQDPVRQSLAEALLLAEQGGAVAVWASSGMPGATGQAELLAEWVHRIGATDTGSGSEAAKTLGEAAVEAAATTGDGDARKTYNLLGDPSMRLRR